MTSNDNAMPLWIRLIVVASSNTRSRETLETLNEIREYYNGLPASSEELEIVVRDWLAPLNDYTA